MSYAMARKQSSPASASSETTVLFKDSTGQPSCGLHEHMTYDDCYTNSQYHSCFVYGDDIWWMLCSSCPWASPMGLYRLPFSSLWRASTPFVVGHQYCAAYHGA
eukprot:3321236-Amphidinium_carterae.1